MKEIKLELFGYLLDEGGIYTLIVTIILTLIIMWRYNLFNYIKENIDDLKSVDPLRILPILALLGLGLVSFWLTIRVIALYTIQRYLLDVSFNYHTRDIFEMLAYILTTNLCFSLFKALIIKSDNKDKTMEIKGFFDVAIQGIIIGLVIFIPRHGDPIFIERFGAPIHYVLIFLSMITSIAVLVFARQRLDS